MKTKLYLIAAVAMLGAVHAANAQDRVTWWYEQATPAQQKLIQDNIVEPFDKANPKYNLSIDYRGNEIDKQLRVALLAGNGPDVVYTAGPSYVAPMADAGQLLPLDDYASKYGWNDRILKVFLEMGRYNGKLYALPKTYETVGLFYNKTLFDKHGWTPPKSLDELEALAAKMKDAGITPFAAGNADWRGANEWFVTLALNAVAGPENLNKALRGDMPWTAEPFVKSIDRLKSWWEDGYFGKNYFSLTSSEQAADMMASGRAGMMPTGTWQFQNVTLYGKKDGSTAGFVGFPSASGDPVFPLGIGSTFSIASKSSDPDGAAALINFVFSPKVYGSMNSAWQGEWNIPLKDLSKAEMTDEVTPLFTQTMKTLSTAVKDGNYGYTTWTFLPPATDSYLINGIEQVWLDKISTEDFLSKLDETFQREKKAGKVPSIPAR
ncbi:ABC transporter substrate-binding protein [Pararhizobium mangrovi]|uniref:Extracellular solute-binding protein n=1 Tax=Pararhizobium mangrovi TaxID=2590452 RepID=A0A506UBS7_9HYPH|nr:extracellular solute-binding protein [Pararhizobium mangrovi]TPW30295.1 extracellular solute-binding protein [Pararhizobium mangrovi]